jgi:hypothetical protein
MVMVLPLDEAFEARGGSECFSALLGLDGGMARRGTRTPQSRKRKSPVRNWGFNLRDFFLNPI